VGLDVGVAAAVAVGVAVGVGVEVALGRGSGAIISRGVGQVGVLVGSDASASRSGVGSVSDAQAAKTKTDRLSGKQESTRVRALLQQPQAPLGDLHMVTL
jgi:hypothetical protein